MNPSQDSSIGSISAWYREVLGSNPNKGENFLVKISNWIQTWGMSLNYSTHLHPIKEEKRVRLIHSTRWKS